MIIEAIPLSVRHFFKCKSLVLRRILFFVNDFILGAVSLLKLPRLVTMVGILVGGLEKELSIKTVTS